MEFFSIIVPIVTYDLFESFDWYQDFISHLSSNEEVPEDETEESGIQDEEEINLISDQT